MPVDAPIGHVWSDLNGFDLQNYTDRKDLVTSVLLWLGARRRESARWG